MRIPWRGALALALTVFLLWYAFRGIAWGDVGANLRSANPWLMALSVVIATMVFPLRALRWRPILDPVAPNLPFGPLWRATAMGFMANNTLPSGRVGEVLRPFALSREAPVPFAAGFASLVVDRVFDVVVVVTLTLLALLDPRLPSSVSPAMLLTGTVLGMGGLAVALYAIVYFPDKLIAVFEFVARRVAPRLEDKGREILKTFAAGLSVLRSPRRFVIVLLWAFALWLTQAVAFWIAFIAVGIDLPFSAALMVQGIIVVAAALPSVAPGLFGAFETAGIAGLGLYGVDKTLALTWGATFHVLSLIPITLIGIYYLARSGLKLGDLKQLRELMRVARVAAQAKVNLVLRVGPRRPDGFHDIITMFQLLDLADDIVVRADAAARTLHVAGQYLPPGGLGPTEKNLAYRAAVAYSERAGWPNGFSIELIKNIPAGGGLGGGSSDAGAVLRALDALAETPLGPSALEAIGAKLGSDVPFFVSGSACAFGAGRGEEIAGLDPLPARDVLLAIPPFGVSTADAYRWLDEDRAASGAPVVEPLSPRQEGKMASMAFDDIDWDLMRHASFNDFEPVVEHRHAALARLRESFVAQGASIARLSGSGSTVFGVFDTIPALPRDADPGTIVLRTRTSTRVVPVEVRE